MKQIGFGILISLCLTTATTYAATPIDLTTQPYLFNASSLIKIKEISRHKDFNQTLHVRIKQTYQGYPVWGGDGVVHIPHVENSNLTLSRLVTPKTTMNGKLYDNLSRDLTIAPASDAIQAKAAIQQAIHHYQNKVKAQPEVHHQQTQLIVYIDGDNNAHWAYLIKFFAAPIKTGEMPEQPAYIIDAQSHVIYKNWNDLKTDDAQLVKSGGIGGNLKTGKLMYDYGKLSGFLVQRNPETHICSLQNPDVQVKDHRTHQLVSFSCTYTSPEHNNLFWNALDDQANGGYSPNDDAIFTISRLKEMYNSWYHIDPITENGSQAQVTVYTHVEMENAYWNGKQNDEWVIMLGDGRNRMYPSTAPGVIAHELGHGFTEQHSDLVYADHSGGLNESFSDMADQAAQYYALGSNNWMHDAEITKKEGRALRYLDDPTKDCDPGEIPGESCSIIHFSQYKQGTNVHYSSGLFNHVFYLIGTANNWGTKKAFDVMVKANMDYWTPNTTFSEAACGVMKATKDYHYDMEAVVHAFNLVGVDIATCHPER